VLVSSEHSQATLERILTTSDRTMYTGMYTFIKSFTGKKTPKM